MNLHLLSKNIIERDVCIHPWRSNWEHIYLPVLKQFEKWRNELFIFKFQIFHTLRLVIFFFFFGLSRWRITLQTHQAVCSVFSHVFGLLIISCSLSKLPLPYFCNHDLSFQDQLKVHLLQQPLQKSWVYDVAEALLNVSFNP